MQRVYLIICCLLPLAGCAVTVASPAPAGMRWALVIGIDHYEDATINDLQYCVADAKAMARALVDIGGFAPEQVYAMTSESARPVDRPTNLGIFKRLDFLARRLRPEDTLIFFFAGHGFLRDGQYYLATVNADPSTRETLQLTSLPLTLLREKLAGIQARQLVCFLDACRNDPERGRGDTDNVRTVALTRQMLEATRSDRPRETAVLFACAENERAYPWPEQGHGVFTYYILDGMKTLPRTSKGAVTVNALSSYVTEKVGAWSADRNKRQHPELAREGVGALPLITPLPALAPPTPAIPAADVAFSTADALMRRILYQQAIPALTRFLAKYPGDARCGQVQAWLVVAYRRTNDMNQAQAKALAILASPALSRERRVRADCYYVLAECASTQRDYGAAAEYYLQYLNIAGDNGVFVAEAQYRLAEMLYQQGRLEEARWEFQHLLEIAPDNPLAPWSKYSIGMIDLKAGRNDQAITQLLTASRDAREPSFRLVVQETLATAYIARAATWPATPEGQASRMADLHAAIDLLLPAIEQTTNAAERQTLQRQLADAYFQAKDYSKALDVYNTLLNATPPASPDARTIRLSCAHCLYNLKRFQDAVSEYHALTTAPEAKTATEAMYWEANSWFQYALNRKDAVIYTEAITDMRAALTALKKADDDKTPRVALLLAFTLEDLALTGDAAAKAEVRGAFEDVILQWPDSKEAREAENGLQRVIRTIGK